MKGDLESEIVEVVGDKAYQAILDKFAGQRLYIPVKPTEFLIQLIGQDNAEKLCQRFKSLRLDLPIGVDRVKDDRNQQIYYDRQNMTISQLCDKYKMSRSQVLRILSKYKSS